MFVRGGRRGWRQLAARRVFHFGDDGLGLLTGQAEAERGVTEQAQACYVAGERGAVVGAWGEAHRARDALGDGEVICSADEGLAAERALCAHLGDEIGHDAGDVLRPFDTHQPHDRLRLTGLERGSECGDAFFDFLTVQVVGVDDALSVCRRRGGRCGSVGRGS